MRVSEIRVNQIRVNQGLGVIATNFMISFLIGKLEKKNLRVP